MTQWEYCAIVGMTNVKGALAPESPAIWYFHPGRLEVVQLKGLTQVTSLIAQLGCQGWEMVGCGGSATESTYALYFKRPRGEHPLLPSPELVEDNNS